jgi:hypothetical protein
MSRSKHVQQTKQNPAEHLALELSRDLGLSVGQSAFLSAVPIKALENVRDFVLELKQVRFFERLNWDRFRPSETTSLHIADTWSKARADAMKEAETIAIRVENSLGKKQDNLDYKVVNDVDDRIIKEVVALDSKNGTHAEAALKAIREAVGKRAYYSARSALWSKGAFNEAPNSAALVETVAGNAEKYATMAVSAAFAGSLGCNMDGVEIIIRPWQMLVRGAAPLGYMDGTLIGFSKLDGPRKIRPRG